MADKKIIIAGPNGADSPCHDPAGIQAALIRAAQEARRIAAQTNTKLIVVSDSTLAQRLVIKAKQKT